MKNIALALAVAALAGGCAQYDRVGTSNDYAISCPAGQLGFCFTKAKELCPKGYDVVGMNRVNSGEFPMIVENQMIFRDHVTVRCET